MTNAASPFTMAQLTLTGKRALITGASKNIGAALARGFALAGADLVLVARGAAELTATASAIRDETGRRVETLVADITHAGAAGVIKSFVDESLGGVDVLVNNAYSAGSSQAPIVEMADEVWGEVFEANVMAPYRLTKVFAAGMTERGTGSIINLVSGSGFLPSPNMGAYGVSKAALWMMTRYLAVELAPTIRVNAVCPGIVTPDGQPTHDIFRQLLPLVPMQRLGRPDEIVGAAIYLASEAASYTTGEVLFANGGRPW